MRNIEYRKILQDNSSFQLVRTNPKLTGNVKLTADENGNMWLNSIDVSPELANQKYKRFSIDTTHSHQSNIFRFFANGTTPNEVVFDLREQVDTTKTSNDFKDQFDFSHYYSGVRYLPSKLYTERLSYLAPLYLKKEIPDHFVIFKVEDPMNYRIDISKDKYPFETEEYLIDFFKKAQLIKTFDLTEESKVGKYLRKYTSDPNFPSGPLTANYAKDTYTTFNGIMLNAGAFGSRGELLDDFFSDSNPLKHFEDFITAGFERNGIIFPNIINMEFIFNDDTSEKYDFNRYVGFYINKIELDKLSTDVGRIYDERATWENEPRQRRKTYEYEDKIISQTNENGVLLPYSNADLKLNEFNSSFTNKEEFYLNYIDDKDLDLYSFRIDNNSPIIPDYDDASNELSTGKIRLSNTNIDMGKFFGPGRSLIQDKGFGSSVRGFSHNYIKILSNLNHLDQIKFYHPFGTLDDIGGKYDFLTATIGYSVVPNPGDFYAYGDPIDESETGEDRFYFNATGKPHEIASAIEGCLNAFTNRSFRVIRMNEYVFIKSSVAGDHDEKYALAFQSVEEDIFTNIEIDETTGDALRNTNFKFKGGSRPAGNRLVLDREHLNKLNNSFNELLIKTTNGWSKTLKVSNYVDTITEENNKDAISISNALEDYFTKIVLVLELEDEPFISYGEFDIKLIHRPSFGLISFFPVRDFDFDFYSSEYLNFPVNDLYKYFYVPANIQLLTPLNTYRVVGEGSIRIIETGDVYSNLDGDFTIATSPSLDRASYEIISGDVFVSFSTDITTVGNSLTVPINDEDKELEGFEGFFLLKDPSLVVPEEDSDFFNLRQRYINGITSTEYDYYKENQNKDFALKSKMIPYITKWSILNGKDARSNPYRLNAELAFGFNNFSPSHDDRTQNPSNFTHEWFYVESLFDYTETIETIKLNDSYFEEPLDFDRLITEEDYFVEYFTYSPTFGGDEVERTQTRYSLITKNKVKIYETFLKGFKAEINDVINPDNIGPNGKPLVNPSSNRFEDYKFSCLLKVVEEDINDPTKPPIKYRFIEHKDFKFILMLIEVAMGSSDSINDHWDTRQPAPPALYPTQVTNFNFLDTPISVGEKLYDSINGDYKVNLTSVDSLMISDMTYTLLYSLRHKKYNNLESNFSNIKLSSKLDLSTTGAFNGGTSNIQRIDNIFIPKYPQSLLDEIRIFNDSTFIISRNLLLSKDFFLDKKSGVVPLNTNYVRSSSNNFITTQDTTDYVLIDDSNIITSSVPSAIPSSLFRDFYAFKVMTGGQNYYEKLLEKLSFASFKQFVNALDPFIEYESYSLDSAGSAILASKPNFYIEVPDNEVIVKTSGLVASVDNNKPSNFSFSDVIGYEYLKTKLDNSYEINRYAGDFEPLVRDIVLYESAFKFKDNDISDIKLANVKLNIDIRSFGEVVNLNHIKVSSIKVLDLEADSTFDPVYEKLDEIAISRENYFILGSNWEYGFHYNYSNKSTKSPVAGTLRIEEDDTFVAKLITLPVNIELENFMVVELSATEDLQNVDISNIEIVSKETDTELNGIINLNNVITRFLLEDGIAEKFEEFIVESEEYIGIFEETDSYVKEYIAQNILKLYELTDIQFYTKENRAGDSNLTTAQNLNSIDFKFLDDKGRLESGYNLTKNLEINKQDEFILRFSFKKPYNSGLLVSPKIKINFI